MAERYTQNFPPKKQGPRWDGSPFRRPMSPALARRCLTAYFEKLNMPGFRTIMNPAVIMV